MDRPDSPAEAPTPDSVLAALAACHEPIGRQWSALERLEQHLAAYGADSHARASATALMHELDHLAIDHHADEEEDLFPALIEAMAGSDAVCLRSMIEGLSAEHRELEAHWRRVRARLDRIATGAGTSLASADIQAWRALHERHVAHEQRELLPMAARLLDDDALARIGRAMRERRVASGLPGFSAFNG